MYIKESKQQEEKVERLKAEAEDEYVIKKQVRKIFKALIENNSCPVSFERSLMGLTHLTHLNVPYSKAKPEEIIQCSPNSDSSHLQHYAL